MCKGNASRNKELEIMAKRVPVAGGVGAGVLYVSVLLL